jgi:hypothetical protein
MCYALIGANWVIFGSVGSILHSRYAIVSLLLVLLALTFNMLSAYALAEYMRKRFGYAVSNRKRWKAEFQHEKIESTTWPYSKMGGRGGHRYALDKSHFAVGEWDLSHYQSCHLQAGGYIRSSDCYGTSRTCRFGQSKTSIDKDDFISWLLPLNLRPTSWSQRIREFIDLNNVTRRNHGVHGAVAPLDSASSIKHRHRTTPQRRSIVSSGTLAGPSCLAAKAGQGQPPKRMASRTFKSNSPVYPQPRTSSSGDSRGR